MISDPMKSDCPSTKGCSSRSNPTPWLRSKDPRIVCVPRDLGGKDRHSKVRTVRGLRDRRVRLSVPTAIQLYQLQDKLGLNQPSKVIDWLLNAAKDDIDELPALPISPLLLPCQQANECPQIETSSHVGRHDLKSQSQDYLHNFSVESLPSTSISQTYYYDDGNLLSNSFTHPLYSIYKPFASMSPRPTNTQERGGGHHIKDNEFSF